MEYFTGERFRDIKNSKIFDSEGKQIGRLIDAIFKRSSDESGLTLTKFVIGGSRWEEFLEKIGVKPDIDPVFSIELISSVESEKITLSVKENELKSTIKDPEAIEEDEYLFSNLSKMNVVDLSGSTIGNIMDLKFDDDAFQFIIGDGVIEELIEDLALTYDIDFLLHPKIIKSIDEEIQLARHKAELQSTFIKEFNTQDDRARTKMDADRQNQNAIAYFPSHKFS